MKAAEFRICRVGLNGGFDGRAVGPVVGAGDVSRGVGVDLMVGGAGLPWTELSAIWFDTDRGEQQSWRTPRGLRPRPGWELAR
jgi:hypothetical protein